MSALCVEAWSPAAAGERDVCAAMRVRPSTLLRLLCCPTRSVNGKTTHLCIYSLQELS